MLVAYYRISDYLKFSFSLLWKACVALFSWWKWSRHLTTKEVGFFGNVAGFSKHSAAILTSVITTCRSESLYCNRLNSNSLYSNRLYSNSLPFFWNLVFLENLRRFPTIARKRHFFALTVLLLLTAYFWIKGRFITDTSIVCLWLHT